MKYRYWPIYFFVISVSREMPDALPIPYTFILMMMHDNSIGINRK